MDLRRGFKKESNEYAREFRLEMSLQTYEPICPWALAKLLCIPICSLSGFHEVEAEAVSFLTGGGKDQFSAVSVFDKRKRIIVHNDAHHPYRQAANIAHELSHAVLHHPPTPPFDDDGERTYDPEIKQLEKEANWLGPALLISEEAALHIVREKISISNASKLYGVSEQLINMRINVTGARKRTSY